MDRTHDSVVEFWHSTTELLGLTHKHQTKCCIYYIYIDIYIWTTYLFITMCQPQWLSASALWFYHRVMGSIPALNIVKTPWIQWFEFFCYRWQCDFFGVYTCIYMAYLLSEHGISLANKNWTQCCFYRCAWICTARVEILDAFTTFSMFALWFYHRVMGSIPALNIVKTPWNQWFEIFC